MAPPNEIMLRGLLNQKHITIKTGSMLSEVKDGSLIVKTEKGNEEIQTEQTILAIGYRAKHPLFDELQFDYPQIYKLGDSRQVSNILHAVWDGYEIARNL